MDAKDPKTNTHLCSYHHPSLEAWYELLKPISDCTLLTEDGGTFPVHRLILLQASPFFRSLVHWSRKQTTICLHGVKRLELDQILRYIYYKHIEITDKNVCDLLFIADYFLMVDLTCMCVFFVRRNISHENCFRIYHACLQLDHLPIRHACYRYIQFHFHELILMEGCNIHLLPYHDFLFLLRDNWINVSGEEVIWSAIVKWTEHYPTSRYAEVYNLLSYIRLTHLSDDYIENSILKHPIVKDNPFCMKQIEDTKDHFKDSESSDVFTITKRFGFICMDTDLRQPDHIYIFIEESQNENYVACCDIMEIFNDSFDHWRKVGAVDIMPEFAIEISGVLYLFAPYENIACYFNITTGAYNYLPSFLEWRTEFQVVCVNKEIFVIGGVDYTQDPPFCCSSVEVFNAESGTWTKRAPQTQWIRGRAVEFNGKIYVFGDYYDENISDFVLCGQCYNPVFDVWSDIPLPFAYRREFATVVYDGYIYCIGGKTWEESLKSVVKYNPSKNEWTQEKDMPHEFEFPRAVVLQNVLVVFENEFEDRDIVPTNPAIFWDAYRQDWTISEKQSTFSELYKYVFCKIEDSDTIRKIRPFSSTGHEWATSYFTDFENENL